MANQLHPSKQRYTFALPKDLKIRLQKLAKQRQKHLSEVCIEILSDWLARYPHK